MKINSGTLKQIIFESVQAIFKEGLEQGGVDLADSVAVALIDEYGFDEDGAYDIAFDTIDSNTDKLTRDQQTDFDTMLNLAVQSYVNEAVSKKKLELENYTSKR